MTEQELQALVENISIESFQLPFLHKALFNPRLRSTGGRYLLKSHNIEINPQHLEVHGVYELTDIIKHELCHYHLHLAGKGYRHGDSDFKHLLAAVGGSRYCQSVGKRRTVKTRYRYQCINCGKEFVRKRKIDTQKFRCGGCMGHLRLIAGFRVT